MKRTALIGVFFVLALGVIFAGGTTEEPEETITVAVDTLREEGFLPWIGTSGQSTAWSTVFDYSLYADLETMEYIPGVAERWEVANDFRSVTIWIRKGIQFHDGWGELTVEDIKYTLERLGEEGSVSLIAPMLQKNVERIEVVDPYTLTIHIKPMADFLVLLCGIQNPWNPISGRSLKYSGIPN